MSNPATTINKTLCPFCMQLWDTSAMLCPCCAKEIPRTIVGFSKELLDKQEEQKKVNLNPPHESLEVAFDKIFNRDDEQDKKPEKGVVEDAFEKFFRERTPEEKAHEFQQEVIRLNNELVALRCERTKELNEKDTYIKQLENELQHLRRLAYAKPLAHQ